MRFIFSYVILIECDMYWLVFAT